jgi:hypothetical protein
MASLSDKWAAFKRDHLKGSPVTPPEENSETTSPAPQATGQPTPALAAPESRSSVASHDYAIAAPTPRGGSSSWRARVASLFERDNTPSVTLAAASPPELLSPVAPGDLLVRLVRHHCGERHRLLSQVGAAKEPKLRSIDLRQHVLSFLASYGGPNSPLSPGSVEDGSPTKHHHRNVRNAVDRLIAADVPTDFVLEHLRGAYGANVASPSGDSNLDWTALERRSWMPLVAPLLPARRGLNKSTVNTKGHAGGGVLELRPEPNADAQWFTFHGAPAIIDHAQLRVYYQRPPPQAAPVKGVTSDADLDLERGWDVRGADEHPFVAQLFATGLPVTRGAAFLAPLSSPVDGAGSDAEDGTDSTVSTSVGNRSVCSNADLDVASERL